MDPFDRYLRRPLPDLLVAQGLLSREKADELVASVATSGEPFSRALLESGTLTSWDLARTIAVHYQMPVQPLSGYRFDKDLLVGVPAELLHRHQLLPLGVFGSTRTFAVCEPPTRGLLDDLTAACGASLFFFVAEATDVQRLLREHVKVVNTSADAGWQKLFDAAEDEVSKDLTRPAPRA